MRTAEKLILERKKSDIRKRLCVRACMYTHFNVSYGLTDRSSLKADKFLLQPTAHTHTQLMVLIPQWIRPPFLDVRARRLRPVDGLLQAPGPGLVLLQLSTDFVLLGSSRCSLQEPAVPQSLWLKHRSHRWQLPSNTWGGTYQIHICSWKFMKRRAAETCA